MKSMNELMGSNPDRCDACGGGGTIKVCKHCDKESCDCPGWFKMKNQECPECYGSGWHDSKDEYFRSVD